MVKRLVFFRVLQFSVEKRAGHTGERFRLLSWNQRHRIFCCCASSRGLCHIHRQISEHHPWLSSNEAPSSTPNPVPGPYDPSFKGCYRELVPQAADRDEVCEIHAFIDREAVNAWYKEYGIGGEEAYITSHYMMVWRELGWPDPSTTPSKSISRW